jgi:hypothetical protein
MVSFSGCVDRSVRDWLFQAEGGVEDLTKGPEPEVSLSPRDRFRPHPEAHDRHECRRVEGLASPAATSFGNFKSTNGTGIKRWAVPLCFLKFVSRTSEAGHGAPKGFEPYVCRRSLPPSSLTPNRAIAAPRRFGYAGRHAPVAQLDRALPSEGRGQGFESLRARQSTPEHATDRATVRLCAAVR